MNLNVSTRIASLCILSLFSSCVSTPQTVDAESPSAIATPQPAESSTSEDPVVDANPSETKDSETPGLTPEASAAPDGGAPSDSVSAAELAQIARLNLQFSTRYLESQGETQQLQVQLLDANGNLLNLGSVPLEYRSSRPNDFSVSESGLVTALVDYGYSNIQVSLGDLQVSQLFSVDAGGSSGGSGNASGSNAGPTEETIQGTVEFQF